MGTACIYLDLVKLGTVLVISQIVATREVLVSWLDGSVVERRSLTGELSLACTEPAADG